MLANKPLLAIGGLLLQKWIRRSCGQSFSDASTAELQHLAMLAGFAPATVGLDHVLQTGSRTRINNTRRSLGRVLDSGEPEPGEIRTRWLPCTPRRQSGVFKRPTKLSDSRLPLSCRRLGIRWWDSNPRPPAYEACTPNRQSVCSLAGRRGWSEHCSTIELHPHPCGWMIGLEPTTDVLQPAVAAAKVDFQKRQPTKKMVQTRH